MARGRIISTTIGESRKFAALNNHLHQLVYLMLLPWVDREGRIEADPYVISKKTMMRLEVPEAEVQAALEAMHSVGLITLYEVGDTKVLEVCDFHRFNKPHHREPESDLPPPPNLEHDALMLPKRDMLQRTMKHGSANQVASSRRSEVKGSEVKGSEVKGSEKTNTVSTPTSYVTADTPAEAEDDFEVQKAQALADRQAARNISPGIIHSQHPLVAIAFNRLQSVYRWEGERYKAIASKILELAREHGDEATTAGLEAVLTSGEQIKQPIAYAEKVIQRHALVNAPTKPEEVF